MDIGLTVWN